MNEIVILTPSYNRAKTLPKLYDSLKKQNYKKFDWIIVDDGSQDETKSFVKEIINENIINIKYIYQTNGGKAKALNSGFERIDYVSVFVVVDSDDYLLPTAMETIADYLKKYQDNKEVGAFFFYYKTPDGKLLKPNGKAIESDILMTRYQYNNIYKLNDGCVCYLNKAVKKYRYPEFESEKYIGPTVIQLEMAKDFKIVFSTKIIGVAEYLDTGLTQSGRQLRLKNPLGMIHYCKLMITPEVGVLTRIKYAISIWPYARIAKKSFFDILKMVNSPFLLGISYLPGQLLYHKWKKFR
ncbi:glycosyltransferase family A protein [Cytobacillus kochii]|uniref:glycosyltransferase family A protein n=1 Tax=Cytobacillus kochii TaxID=859143 RepID=UPI00402A7D9D